jgi:hypothetical protein
MDPENEEPIDGYDTDTEISRDFEPQALFGALNDACLSTEIRYKRYFFRDCFVPFLESHSR